jgi:hypothetical protein
MSTFTAQAVATISPPRSGAADTLVEVVSNELLLPGKNDAAAEAALVVRGFRSGVRAVIDSCVRTNEAIRRFREDPASIDAFLAVLVDGNVISRNEGRLGKASPKLVKLCAIGAHCGLLNREEIFQYLEPGYTIIYQVVVLYNTLRGDEDARFDQLVRILRQERHVSREALIALTQATKRENRPASIELASSSANGSSDSVKPNVEIGRNHKLVLLTPDRRRDLRRLNEDYVDRPRYSQLVHDLVAEEATAVVVARLADLPVIENKLLPLLGFPGPCRVLLVREPIGWDVTDAEVIVIAQRGAATSTTDFRWLSSIESFDVVSTAELLVPDAKQKLHLFAQERSVGSGGWYSVIGMANWSHDDE